MSVKHVLGLDTKEERRHAYTLVQRVYQKALRTDELVEYSYALGYIEAVGDLLVAEAPDQKELLKLLAGMQAELLRRGAIPV